MSKELDILEIVELIQLSELAEANLITDISWHKRLVELNQKYTAEDIATVSVRAAHQFSDITGLLKKQKCTNKNCGYIFYSEDVSNTCDICYHTTLRLLND